MPKSIADLRRRAYEAQAGGCFYCGFPMWESDELQFARRWGIPPTAARRFQCTAEHLVPVSAGGRTCHGNIVAACWFCNQTRHRAGKVRSPEQYTAYVRKRLAVHRWHPHIPGIRANGGISDRRAGGSGAHLGPSPAEVALFLDVTLKEGVHFRELRTGVQSELADACRLDGAAERRSGGATRSYDRVLRVARAEPIGRPPVGGSSAAPNAH
jgi:HNH endonuclease